MTKFNQKDFNDFILENKIVKLHENPITLNSGEVSNVYVNWRPISNDVYLMDRLSNYILDFADDLGRNFDSFYGVPEDMSKLAVISQFKRTLSKEDLKIGDYNLPMGRGKEKTHGSEEDKDFIGQPKGKIIILEDVVTTGCSMLKEIYKINGSESQIISAIVLTDRMEPSNGNRFKKELQSLRVCYHPLSNLKELEKNL